MRSHLENMERTAREVLQQDATFFEALQALKWEIERDHRVRSAVSSLRGAGCRVFTSFVPSVKIRVRTRDGVFALPGRSPNHNVPATGEGNRLIEELTKAASAVILSSRIRQQLDTIVNEAVGSSEAFENIASEIERKGDQVLIRLDLSTYAQVHEAPPVSQQEDLNALGDSEQEPHMVLSRFDLEFMKSLKIKAN